MWCNPKHYGDPLFLPELLRLWGVPVVESPGWRDWGMGDFGKIWGVVCHHTGANNTSAEFIKHNPTLENALSSQIHLSRDGVATIVGAGVAWHAGRGSWPGIAANNANACTIGIEAQSDGKTPWPAKELESYYRICAAICWYLGLPATRVIGHKEWARVQGKWDPGGIDMDDFRGHVQALIDRPPFVADGGAGEGVFMALSDEEQREILALVRDIKMQLRGPSDSGWPQLGKNDRGQFLTLVDAVAALRHDVAALGKRGV